MSHERSDDDQALEAERPSSPNPPPADGDIPREDGSGAQAEANPPEETALEHPAAEAATEMFVQPPPLLPPVPPADSAATVRLGPPGEAIGNLLGRPGDAGAAPIHDLFKRIDTGPAPAFERPFFFDPDPASGRPAVLPDAFAGGGWPSSGGGPATTQPAHRFSPAARGGNAAGGGRTPPGHVPPRAFDPGGADQRYRRLEIEVDVSVANVEEIARIVHENSKRELGKLAEAALFEIRQDFMIFRNDVRAVWGRY